MGDRLPTEVILFICYELHPVDAQPSFRDAQALAALGALACANRRFWSIANGVLYRVGIESYDALPLAWAAKYGVLGTLKEALAAGASAHCTFHNSPAAWDMWKNTFGGEQFLSFPCIVYTAIHLAASEGHKDIVDILLDHGAELDARSAQFCDCTPPRSLWETLDDQSRRQELTSATAADHDSWCHWPPLHLAICSSHVETAGLLVSRGAPVTHPSDWPHETGGYGALHQAAADGHVDLLKHILDSHPELGVDEPSNAGLTPFYFAFANHRWDTTIPLLLSRGANPDTLIRFQFDLVPSHHPVAIATTPLGEACRLGRFEDAIRLLDMGADMTSGVQVWGSVETHIPLLHICCMDFGPRDQHRRTVLRWPGEAQAASRPRIIARLIADGLSPDLQWDTGHGDKETPLSVAAQHLNAPAVKALLDAGADVRIRDARGKNVLMAAVAGDLTPHRAWELVPRGWDVEEDNVSRALLVFRLLLDAGIPINDADPFGNTALHLFFAYPIRLDPSALQEVLRLLLAKGADPSICNKDGVSAFQVAVRHRCLFALEVLSGQQDTDVLYNLSADDVAAAYLKTAAP